MALHKISQRQLPLLFFGAGLPQLTTLAGEAKTYAERLFDYLSIDRLDSSNAQIAIVELAKRESVYYDDDALEMILEETGGYPFFLQVWGSHIWETSFSSPITVKRVRAATKKAILALDEGFFKIRYDRLSDRQQEYVRAMSRFGSSPANSTAIAKILGITVKQAAPVRDEVIKKGMAYSPRRGLVAFTVPKFDEFVERTTLYK